jgi:t-SNARE complex subunit (syntaxin)
VFHLPNGLPRTFSPLACAPFARPRRVTQDFLEDLKTQTSNIERCIAAVKLATEKIVSNNEQSALAVGEEVQRLSTQMAQVVKEGVAQSARGKNLLDQLKKDGDLLSRTNPSSERLPLMKSKYTRYCKEYVDAMKEHQKAKESMRKTQVDSVVRQVSTLPKFKGKSESEIKAEVEKTGAAAYLQEAIMEEAADEAQDAYRDAQSRAKDIEMLARSINEVAGMFQDLATLIQHQTETLDSIERNVDSAGNFMRKGNQAVRGARLFSTCCCCYCCCCCSCCSCFKKKKSSPLPPSYA